MSVFRRVLAACSPLLVVACAHELAHGPAPTPHPSVAAAPSASASAAPAEAHDDVIPISAKPREAGEKRAAVPAVTDACRASARIDVGKTVARDCWLPNDKHIRCVPGIAQALAPERVLDEATKDRLLACACATTSATNAPVDASLGAEWSYGFDDDGFAVKANAPARAPKCMSEALEAQDFAALRLAFHASDYGKNPQSSFIVRAPVRVTAPKPAAPPPAAPSPEENTRALRDACASTVDVHLSGPVSVKDRGEQAASLTPEVLLDDETRHAVAECVCDSPSLQRASYRGTFEVKWQLLYMEETYCGTHSSCACADGRESGKGACFDRSAEFDNNDWIPFQCGRDVLTRVRTDVDQKLARAFRKEARAAKAPGIRYRATANVEIVKR